MLTTCFVRFAILYDFTFIFPKVSVTFMSVYKHSSGFLSLTLPCSCYFRVSVTLIMLLRFDFSKISQNSNLGIILI
jgi:hypothetical protein